MSTVTPNFNWPVPTSTDLVRDGATAIEALGDSIDASLVDLKGGTTGQVLSKTSGTDMDFTWVTSDDANAIQNTIVDAKGDLIAATAADTPARLAVGSDYGFLQALASQSTGLLWNNAAWTSYTPTISAQTGSITTSSGEGYYTRVGKMCALYVRANVLAKGTGSGYLAVTIPFQARGIIEQIGVGRETGATGKALTASVAASGNFMAILAYDVTTVIVDGYRNIISMVYEVA
jgi:hypothetical protein